ncbi:MAG TPA: hypothetical protein VFV50_12625 [Bdellovibrionales bacterium]|nr:hypothetical protein [Bdellovibrionales bacterium]
MKIGRLMSVGSRLIGAFVLLSACQGPGGLSTTLGPQASPTPEPSLSVDGLEPLQFSSERQKRAWIDKTARSLRNGRGLTGKSELQKLMPLTSIQIADALMKGPAFTETVLDFNLYFLGKKVNHITEPYYGDPKIRLFATGALAYPQAVTAALEVSRGGDYLRLLQYKQPMYGQLLPLPKEQMQRLAYLKTFGEALDKAIATLSGQHDKQQFCNTELNNLVGPFFQLQLGGNAEAFVAFTGKSGVSRAFAYCFTEDTNPAPYVADLKKMRSGLESFAKEIERLEGLTPSERVEDLPVFDLSSITSSPTDVFSGGFWRDYPNSSTNSNRKRGAYILKQYFCDDLTPVGVVVPDSHATGAHGSEPSCFACHYKLDPMSGFFRDRGFQGHDFSYSPIVLFDDAALKLKGEYQKQWQNPNGSWNVGYVRSLQFPQKNEYAGSFEELFAIIRKAPEVRQCLVKRLYQYFLSETQAVDRGYLEMAAAEFIKLSETNSTVALKSAILRITHSRTFSHPNPQEDQCYDYRAGDDPSQKPPCKVSFLLEKNCASCHQGSSAAAGLDLTRWIKTEGGEYGFPHLSENGAQVKPAVTFKRISELLTTADPNKRMPLRRFITSQDQQALYLWAESMGKKR